jgi:hypothetical protein
MERSGKRVGAVIYGLHEFPGKSLTTYTTGSEQKGGCAMNIVSKRLGIAILTVVVLYCLPAASQLSPTTNRAPQVKITGGPELELARPTWAIVRWTCDNPGGSPEHYGIVHYGIDAKNLNETAKSPIRLNPSHPSTVFRVRIDGLQPKTTYYYTVASMGANGDPDAVQKSPVKQFTTQ